MLRAVDGVSLSLDKGEVLGIVGESGSGKSVTMLALMGLVAYPGRVRAKRLRFDGHDLLTMSDRERRTLIGKDVAMIFQEPTTSLNPCFTIGFQLAETLRLHLGMDRKAARAARDRAAGAGRHSGRGEPADGLSAPALGRHEPARDDRDGDRLQSEAADRRRADHGARRDDPGADPRPAARRCRRERGMALVLITHNMGVVSEMAQRVAVMYAGQIMEERPRDALFAAPQHPYTAALLAAMPERSDGGRASPRFRAWCRDSTTGPPAACSLRAAPMRPLRRAGGVPICGRGWTARSAATIRSAIPRAMRRIARERPAVERRSP